MDSSVAPKTRNKRILFVAEAVTLAHVTRLVVLADALHATGYEVHFAAAPSYDSVLRNVAFARHAIWSVAPAQFLDALARGRPVYDLGTLERYVEDDLALLRNIAPDLVVGDFRLSLAVSAPVAGVPYAALTNAHWSPWWAIGRFPMPQHPLARALGETAAGAVFALLRAAIFARHARPLNALRLRHGLSALGDLRHVYTSGDYTLYADTPTLAPTRASPANHHYIGPVLWSPELAPPPWWDALPDRPCIYLTLGSTGQVDALPAVLRALRRMPVNVLVATAGRLKLDAPDGNVWACEYLPGAAAARRSALVICNGGSATVYQALAEGVPVLGIPSNLDQHLTMVEVARAGAGISVRAEKASEQQVARTVKILLEQCAYREAAGRIAAEFAQFDARRTFPAFVAGVASHRTA